MPFLGNLFAIYPSKQRVESPARSVVRPGKPNRFTNWGRHGFDVGVETLSACRGTDHLVNTAVNLIVANDDNYALAA